MDGTIVILAVIEPLVSLVPPGSIAALLRLQDHAILGMQPRRSQVALGGPGVLLVDLDVPEYPVLPEASESPAIDRGGRFFFCCITMQQVASRNRSPNTMHPHKYPNRCSWVISIIIQISESS